MLKSLTTHPPEDLQSLPETPRFYRRRRLAAFRRPNVLLTRFEDASRSPIASGWICKNVGFQLYLYLYVYLYLYLYMYTQINIDRFKHGTLRHDTALHLDVRGTVLVSMGPYGTAPSRTTP